jgi:hypothetical protein
MSKEYDEYERLAETGAFPADFDQWGLADKNGWTLAHDAAAYGQLPVLGPVGFSMWDMSNNAGWTVAHVVVSAQEVLLPEDFDQWGLTDENGKTVLSCISFGIQLDEYVSRWVKEMPLCRTSADWEVFKKELPEIYQKYAISDHMIDADNDQGALLL